MMDAYLPSTRWRLAVFAVLLLLFRKTAAEHYVVRIPVFDEQIKYAVDKVDAYLVNSIDPQFADHIDPLDDLHVTLVSFKLSAVVSQYHLYVSASFYEEDEGFRVVQALKIAASDYRASENDLNIHFKGINQFGSTTLYASVRMVEGSQDRIKRLRDYIIQRLHVVPGLQLVYDNAFHPHMTIVNLQTPAAQALGYKWASLINSNTAIGTEEAKGFQLTKRSGDAGHYIYKPIEFFHIY
ncbi:hypothetical protein AAVH_18108 [Aphelenchoides avenae]|nr:hypothetical protein AAVH_18108 [Aphelenchus avenae]